MLQILYSLSTYVLAAFLALLAVLPADTVPITLLKMADTERAFAKQAAETTIWAAFGEYFSDESINFDPAPGPARDRLRKEPNAFPKELRMKWEPRVGDISAGGDMGYLTGPVESTMPGQPLRYGNYFSVWKKQANGEYRVILDVGSRQPEKPRFADGFVRSTALATYKGKDTKAAAEASLLDADKAFSTAIAKSAHEAYMTTMHAAGRLHRSGYLSMTSRDAASAWLRDHVKTMTSTPMKSETAASRDLGYTWGRFTVTSPDARDEQGYYVRVWTRAATGAWQLVADITEPSRPPVASAPW
jgi:ketosteroid isomerase-like protein